MGLMLASEQATPCFPGPGASTACLRAKDLNVLHGFSLPLSAYFGFAASLRVLPTGRPL
jgi:hypothetical protein